MGSNFNRGELCEGCPQYDVESGACMSLDGCKRSNKEEDWLI